MHKTQLLLAVLFGSLAPLAVSAGDPAEKNLALGRPCSVFSSYEADGWSKTRLTDGQTGDLGWSSKAFAAHETHTLYPEYVVIDLGRCARIDRVVLHPRGDFPRPEHLKYYVLPRSLPPRGVRLLTND